MIHRMIGTISILALATVSAFLYDHRGRHYAKGKADRLPSQCEFRWIYRIVQVTTIGLSVMALLSDRPVLLKFHHSVWIMYAGLATTAAGMTLFVWAKRALGSEYSPCFDSFQPNRLVKSGPYAWVRHPMYGANLVVLLGLFLATGSLWLVGDLLTVLIYYLRAAHQEEHALSESLPGYREYVQYTGAFWPRLRASQRPISDAS